jgi:hypothetical protein
MLGGEIALSPLLTLVLEVWKQLLRLGAAHRTYSLFA